VGAVVAAVRSSVARDGGVDGGDGDSPALLRAVDEARASVVDNRHISYGASRTAPSIHSFRERE
jgi:hypothetical protein